MKYGLFLTLALIYGGAAHAQRAPVSGHGITFSFSAGPTVALPEAFSNAVCPSHAALSLGPRLGLRVWHRLLIEGGASAYLGSASQCVTSPILIRPFGPDTVSVMSYPSRYAGMTFTSMDLRLAAEIIRTERVSGRLFVGGGRIFEKSLNSPLVGASLAIGRRNRFTIDVEQWQFQMTRTEQDQFYNNGFASSNRVVAKKVAARPTEIRLGIAVPVGG